MLYSFTGEGDGVQPRAGLIADEKGNLYGTAALGGAHDNSVVFKITATGEESALYAFAGLPDGAEPYGGLTRDDRGNLYGTTLSGGQYNYGTVFKLQPNGTLKILHSFARGSDGASPFTGLTMDLSGNLYGTTAYGGSADSGAVFKITR